MILYHSFNLILFCKVPACGLIPCLINKKAKGFSDRLDNYKDFSSLAANSDSGRNVSDRCVEGNADPWSQKF